MASFSDIAYAFTEATDKNNPTDIRCATDEICGHFRGTDYTPRYLREDMGDANGSKEWTVAQLSELWGLTQAEIIRSLRFGTLRGYKIKNYNHPTGGGVGKWVVPDEARIQYEHLLGIR